MFPRKLNLMTYETQNALKPNIRKRWRDQLHLEITPNFKILSPFSTRRAIQQRKGLYNY